MTLKHLRPRLAELCGLRRGKDTITPTSSSVGGSAILSNGDYSVRGMSWRPDEDVAQAIRCLEACGWSWKIQPGAGGYVCDLVNRDMEHAFARGDTLPVAICLAIAAAMKWETP